MLVNMHTSSSFCTTDVLLEGCLQELFPGNFNPTPTHYFMKLLHDKGLLLRCFTQVGTAAQLPNALLPVRCCSWPINDFCVDGEYSVQVPSLLKGDIFRCNLGTLPLSRPWTPGSKESLCQRTALF